MAFVLKDRVQETTTTTGTGTLTLAGAVTGFSSFAGIGNANTTYYCITDATGAWESGIGTYTSAGTTLSRDTVISNSLGTTAKINFGAGTKYVFCAIPADDSIFMNDLGAVGIGTNSPNTFSGGAARTVITNTSAGNNTIPLALVNSDATNNTSVSLDFNPSTSIALAQIRAVRTNTNFDGATDIRFLNYVASTGLLTERGRFSSNGEFQFNSGYGSVATAYGCRAWVNFNGTGTVAIRNSGNVSSITDNGTGDYTINMTNAMPDVNYATVGTAGQTQIYYVQVAASVTAPTTSAVRIWTSNDATIRTDSSFVYVSIFR